MWSRTFGLKLGVSTASLFTLLLLSGCNNTLNPLCSSSRPAPQIGSLSPSTVSFSDLQSGTWVTVNGSNFVSASEVVVNSTTLTATVLSPTQLKVKITTDIVSAPGAVNVKVNTPSGNSGDLGCTSGGQSSVLVLTVD